MKIRYIILTLLLALSSCAEDFLTRDFPSVLTLSVTETSDRHLLFSGEIISRSSVPVDEVGFLWQSGSDPDIENGFRANLAGKVNNGPFSLKVSTSIKRNTDYYVKAYARVGELIIYGDTWVFSSNIDFAPPVLKIEPSTGQVGDTVEISGGLFERKIEKYTVTVDNINTTLLEITDSLLKVVIPIELNKYESTVVVSYEGLKSVLPDKFFLKKPEINSVSPLSVEFLDTVKITGTGFHKISKLNSVKIGSTSCQVISSTFNELKIIIPYTADTISKVRVTVAGQTAISTETLNIKVPKLPFFYPTEGFLLDTLNIVLNSVDPATVNQVQVNGIACRIISKDPKTIVFEVPESLSNLSSAVTLQTAGGPIELTEKFILLSPAISSVYPVQIKYGQNVTIKGMNLSRIDRINSVVLSTSGGNILFSPNYISDDSIKFTYYNQANPSEVLPFKTFTPGIKYDNKLIFSNTPVSVIPSWSLKSPFQGQARYKATSFVIGDRIFAGFGASPGNVIHKDLYEYIAGTDQWVRKADIPGPARSYPRSFSNSNYGFTGAGFSGDNSDKYQLYDFWSFDPVNNLWQRTVDYPDMMLNFYVGFTASTRNNKCYAALAGNTSRMKQYSAGTWINYSTPQILTQAPASGILSFDNIFIVIIGYKTDNTSCNQVWEYNTDNDQWTRKADFPGNARFSPAAFVIGNYGYYGCGMATNQSQFKDIWRYDPANDSWIRYEDFPGGYRSHLISNSTSKKGFIGLGLKAGEFCNDFWMFDPK